MKRAISLTLALIMAVCCVSALPSSAETEDEMILQDINYSEVIGRVDQPDSGFAAGRVELDSLELNAESEPRDDRGFQYYVINLCAFSERAGGTDGDITEWYLNYVDATLANLRKNGGSCIILSTYNVGEKDFCEPKDIGVIVDHQEQLCRVLGEYEDIIIAVECGMIGKRPAMYDLTLDHEYKWLILERWLLELPSGIDVNVDSLGTYVRYVNRSSEYRRIVDDDMHFPVISYDPNRITYPVSYNETNYYKFLFEKDSRLSDLTRIGIVNDTLLQDGNDGGRFSGGREAFVTWLGQRAESISYGAGLSGVRSVRHENSIWLPERAIPELYVSHLAYYRDLYNSNVNDLGAFKGEYVSEKTYESEEAAKTAADAFNLRMEQYAGSMSYGCKVEGVKVTYTTGGWDSATVDKKLVAAISGAIESDADMDDYIGRSVSDYFDDHIGYRPVLRVSYLSGTVTAGGVLTLSGRIDNVGTDDVTADKEVSIIVTNGEKSYEVVTDIKTDHWRSGKRYDYDIEIKLPADIAAGEYEVYMSADGVRFANPGQFAYDVLSSEFTESNADLELIYNSDLDGNYLGKFTVEEGQINGSDNNIKQVYTRFKDVKEDWWYTDYIKSICSLGIMGGMPNGTFSPDGTATRAQMVTVLYNMEGRPDVSEVHTPFNDIRGWYNEAVRWAYSVDIVNGVSETSFAPNEEITREAFVTMLYRYAQYKDMDVDSERNGITSFDDRKEVSPWALPAVKWAVKKGIIIGSNSLLKPRNSITRAETATILSRYNDGYYEERYDYGIAFPDYRLHI